VKDNLATWVNDIGDNRRLSDANVYEPTIGNIGG
jgi:hypothetical protein